MRKSSSKTKHVQVCASYMKMKGNNSYVYRSKLNLNEINQGASKFEREWLLS